MSEELKFRTVESPDFFWKDYDDLVDRMSPTRLRETLKREARLRHGADCEKTPRNLLRLLCARGLHNMQYSTSGMSGYCKRPGCTHTYEYD